MNKKYKLIIITILAIIATFNAFYLSSDWLFGTSQDNRPQLNYFETSIEKQDNNSFCDINETISCSNVLENPLAKIYGIPFPVIALFFYPLIILLTIIGIINDKFPIFKILIFGGIGGLLFNGYFIYQEIFHIGAYCPLCLLCTFIIFCILIIALINRKK